MRNRDVSEIFSLSSFEFLARQEKRSEVFHIVVFEDGTAHFTPRDGISFFESIDKAEAFAEELVNSGEALKAYVQTIDGYGIPYDPDPEIYSDALRREAARRLRQADDEAYERYFHQWRRENTMFQISTIIELDAPAEYKRDFILELLGTLGLPEMRQTVCRNMNVDTFLTMCATTFLK
jgi:hypothetical protein